MKFFKGFSESGRYWTQGEYSGPEPSGQTRGNFKNVTANQDEEDSFDFARFRGLAKPSGITGSTAHLVKGALGGGILGGHVAFMKAGFWPSITLTLIFGIYIGYSLYILVRAAHILYRRTRVPIMSYPDVGEAALACFPNRSVAKFATCFRYIIDFVICLDLFGSCACYQLMIAKTIKQLVENTQLTSLAPTYPGYPSLRVYLAVMMIFVIMICLITHLKWLAPFSIAANLFIVVAIGMTIYYAMENNPNFEGMKPYTSIYETIEFLGMSVFSMSCAGVVLPVSNNMVNPAKYPIVLFSGMSIIILFVYLASTFGYVGYLELCESPITINFPMTTLPKILKGLIAFMIYVTHALNFWVPFNLVFFYLKRDSWSERKALYWELFYRALFVVIIAVCAIVFPAINSLMGFLGAFCLSFMAFIWPAFIEMLVLYERPGYGFLKWRLWKDLFLMMVGFFLCVIGSYVNMAELIIGMGLG